MKIWKKSQKRSGEHFEERETVPNEKVRVIFKYYFQYEAMIYFKINRI